MQRAMFFPLLMKDTYFITRRVNIKLDVYYIIIAQRIPFCANGLVWCTSWKAESGSRNFARFVNERYLAIESYFLSVLIANSTLNMSYHSSNRFVTCRRPFKIAKCFIWAGKVRMVTSEQRHEISVVTVIYKRWIHTCVCDATNVYSWDKFRICVVVTIIGNSLISHNQLYFSCTIRR